MIGGSHGHRVHRRIRRHCARAGHKPRLYVDALGLPLEASPGSDYFHSERSGGAKHFGVWPLAEAA
jgi:hypothetical protein